MNIIRRTFFSVLSNRKFCSSALLPLRTTPCAKPPAQPRLGYHPYVLISNRVLSPDSRLLRFSIEDGLSLCAPLPSCLKVKQELPTGPAGSLLVALLDKSYSPVSFPDEPSFFDLVVKAYQPRPTNHPPTHGGAGGLAAWLTSLRPGDTALMKVKAARLFHGEPYWANRWKELGFVAGGTGIAPILQLIRTILSDPSDKTNLFLVFANRREEDILLRDELDRYARQFPLRFRVHYVLSAPPAGWTGGCGWVSREDVERHLPSPSSLGEPGDVMVMVCGRDEFMETVSGRTERGAPLSGKKKGPKLQGKLSGVLRETRFAPAQVYKF